ncbi:V-type ATP synthase subunit D [bacterium]|nr:MAG: V-type ATP synthase subunit D [bacterium]
MERLPSTRQNLLKVRRRIILAGEGLSLLKKKREALVRTFLSHVTERVRYHDLMEKAGREAAGPLAGALAAEGLSGLATYGWAARRELALDVKKEVIWGVEVATFQPAAIRREFRGRGFDPDGAGVEVSLAAGKFEELLQLIFETAASEIRLRNLGEEIRKTSRRINALEGILIPAMETREKKVSEALEESERDERQRYKGLIKRRGR